jgi:hypothetical protein
MACVNATCTVHYHLCDYAQLSLMRIRTDYYHLCEYAQIIITYVNTYGSLFM